MREAARELDILFVVDEVITGLRPHRTDVRVRGRRRRARSHDARQGPDLGLRADGRDDAVGADLRGDRRRRAPTGVADRTRRHLFGASGRRRGRARGAAPVRRRRRARQRPARRARTLPPGSTLCARTRWSAMHAIAACSARSSSSATRRPSAASMPRSAFRIASSRPPTATASCSAASATRILGFAPALTFGESEFEQLFARLRKTLDDVLAAPEVRAALVS